MRKRVIAHRRATAIYSLGSLAAKSAEGAGVRLMLWNTWNPRAEAIGSYLAIFDTQAHTHWTCMSGMAGAIQKGRPGKLKACVLLQ